MRIIKKYNKKKYIYPFIIYLFCFAISTIALNQAKAYGLLPMPIEGTDQRTALMAGVDLYNGIIPFDRYMLSRLHAFYLTILIAISNGDIFIMRILQIAICSFIPVFIYKLAKRLRFSNNIAIGSSFLYCLYGPIILLSLSFLRAAPLTLIYLLFAYYLLKAFQKKSLFLYMVSGIFAGLTILGRENFLVVISSPLIFLLFPTIRKYIKKEMCLIYCFGIFIPVMPMILYNFIQYNSIALIPGNLNNVLSFYHEGFTEKSFFNKYYEIIVKIPKQIYKFISPFEVHNSLSFYAHKEFISAINIILIPFNLLIGFSLLNIPNLIKKKNSIIFISVILMSYILSMLFFDMFYRFRAVTIPFVLILSTYGLYSLFLIKNCIYKSIAILIVVSFFFLSNENYILKQTTSEQASIFKLIMYKKEYNKAYNYIIKLNNNGIDVKQYKHKLFLSINNNNKSLNKENKNE